MLFYPERVAIVGALFWLGLFLVSPLTVVMVPSISSLVFIVGCYAAFLAGCSSIFLLSSRKDPRREASVYNRNAPVPTIVKLMAIGVFGAAIQFYDQIINRSVGLSLSALEQRAALQDAAAGPLSAIGGSLIPFCFMPLILLLASKNRRPIGLWISSILVFCLPIYMSIRLLSRSSMIVAGALVLFSYACGRYNGKLFRPRLLMALAGSALVILIASSVMFYARLSQSGTDISSSIIQSGYSYTLRPNDTAQGLMLSGGGIGSAIESLVPNLIYYLHGMFEFGLLYDRDDTIFSYGVQHFAPYLKLVQVFIGADAIKNFTGQQFYVREGVWTTFFGPLWIDFGWFSFLAMFLFGVAIKRLSLVARRQWEWIPLYAFMISVIFFMLTVNLIVSAHGMYVINAFVAFALISKFSRSRAERASGRRALAVVRVARLGAR